MKIIYFTTACEKEDYYLFCKNWYSSLNTSIQNLHNRLIRSLAMTHEVEVISTRPFSKKYCKLKMLQSDTIAEGKITWHYLQVKRNKVIRYLSARKQAKKILSKMNLKDCIIITDTLNPYLLNTSTMLAKKYNLPIIGICNNTPSAIRGTGRSYTNFLLSKGDNLSGYISLTSGLNKLFNQNNRANLTFEGIIESKFKESDMSVKYGKYIFYNGSLEEKYGVYDLIKAFKELNPDDVKLIITGYHAEYGDLDKAIDNHEGIINLGNISFDDILSFENHSLVNVNPRPYSEDYDRYLIPVNMIDYLGSNSLTLSVKNSKLQNYFSDDVIWINSSDVNDLVEGLRKALEMKGERDTYIKKALGDANKMYSMSAINRKTILFLKQFLKQKD